MLAPIRRRDFITASAASLTALAAQSLPLRGAERVPLVRAAVVIGVNKPQGLPILSAAVSGARSFSDWLRSQGFEVKLFTDEDDQQPVQSSQLTQAITELVNRGTLDQLLIYFSGHGFLEGYTEYWLLSGAPVNVNEAICLRESVELARETAIPSVIFISDACRSTPTTLGASRVRGSVVFPSSATSSNVQTEIDQFLATHPGDPAFEIPVSDSVPAFQGIYTAAFLSAFQEPPEAFVHTAPDGEAFVPNRSLKKYLEIIVPKMAEAKSVHLHQRPDAYVESDYDTYIGRVSAVSAKVADQSPTTLHDVANSELKKAGADVLESTRVMTDSELSDVADRSGFDSARQLVVKAQESPPIGIATGLTINGATSSAVACNSKITAAIAYAGDGGDRPAIVRADLGQEAAGTIALQFSNGNGTVIAVLRNYVAAVVVDGGVVANVSYIPSQNNSRWSDYQNDRDRLDQLRATVATSAKFGQFHIEGDNKTRNQIAEQLADRIRLLKGLDPTLGVYAAYAYTEAGLMEKVRSVSEYMREDLGVNLFDVAMLSGLLPTTEHTVPFVPMLSQGWNLLRVKNVKIAPPLAELRDHLQPALWTTFDPAGTSIVFSALRASSNQ